MSKKNKKNRNKKSRVNSIIDNVINSQEEEIIHDPSKDIPDGLNLTSVAAKLLSGDSEENEPDPKKQEKASKKQEKKQVKKEEKKIEKKDEKKKKRPLTKMEILGLKLEYLTREFEYYKPATMIYIDPDKMKENDLDFLKTRVLNALDAYTKAGGLKKDVYNRLVSIVDSSNPKETMDIAKYLHDQIEKSPILKTYREWHERGGYAEKDDDYEIDELTGLPKDKEALEELEKIKRRVYKKATGQRRIDVDGRLAEALYRSNDLWE